MEVARPTSSGQEHTSLPSWTHCTLEIEWEQNKIQECMLDGKREPPHQVRLKSQGPRLHVNHCHIMAVDESAL